jgi:16S rRNA (cytosine967-C5)-methyltransferase
MFARARSWVSDERSVMKGVAARRLAVEVLLKVEQESAYANLALNAAFNNRTLSERDRAFATFLVQGVLRHRGELDEALSPFLKRPLEKHAASLRNVLRLGAFQLVYADDIPPSAVLNTSAEIAKRMGHAGNASVANAVLRNLLRSLSEKSESGAVGIVAGETDTGDAATGDADNIDALAKRYSVNPWLVSKWKKAFGDEEALRLLEYSQTVPELTLRVCTNSITVDGLRDIFAAKGIKVRTGHLVPFCLVVEDRKAVRGPIEKLPGFNEGLFVVQDEPAAFVSAVVAPRPGEIVVDLCAAPGGKTLHLAAIMENKGRVIAVDIHANRLKLLKESRTRLGLTNIEIKTADGTEFMPDRPAHKVLLDAPCTGTGVINRRSDLRFTREEPHLDELVGLQRRLLEQSARMLAPGGELIYSTCSIEPEENQQNIDWFLDNHPDFQYEDLRAYLPEKLYETWFADNTTHGAIQLMPTRHGVSGFYVAKMKKDPAPAET